MADSAFDIPFAVLVENDLVFSIPGKLTMLLMAAWGLHFLLLRFNPRWRVLLWRCTVVGILLLPAAHLIVPPIVTIQQPTFAATAGDAAHDTDIALTQTAGKIATGQPSTSVSSFDYFAHDPRPQRINAAGASGIPWLKIVWGLGVAFGFLRFVVGIRRIQHLLSDTQLPDQATAKLFDDVATRLEISQRPQLLVSHQVAGPTLCGIVKSTLLIPDGLRSTELPAVFAHELAHVRARDLQWNGAMRLLSILLWCHPLVWRVRATHAEACERVSDNVAAGFVGDVKSYLRTLARIALDAAASPLLSMTMARTPDVRKRMSLLQRKLFENELPRKQAGTLMVVGVLAMTMIGGLKVARAVPSSGHIAAQSSRESDAAIRDDRSVAASSGDVQDGARETQSKLLLTDVRAATSRGLAFLAEQQRADGSIGSGNPGQNDSAVTALCGLAFLAAGEVPGGGRYGGVLQKAIDYLILSTQKNGFVGTSGSMYVHAYAVRFLAEVQIVKPNPKVLSVLRKGADLIVQSQNQSDGWRYSPTSQDADSSVTSCQLIALQTARKAGIDVPQETLDRAIDYLKRCQSNDGGYAYVLPAGQSALPRSAAVMAALYLSSEEGDPVTKGLKYLVARSKNGKATTPYFFFSQFHLSTAMRHAKGQHFAQWYAPCRDQLLHLQTENGSWTQKNYAPEYPTANAIVALLSPENAVAAKLAR